MRKEATKQKEDKGWSFQTFNHKLTIIKSTRRDVFETIFKDRHLIWQQTIRTGLQRKINSEFYSVY